MKIFFQKYGWLALTFFTFLFLLGSRALNEPDEGRYAEISREMIQTGDWLVPHLWYLPHLDKPPMTYWLVAASMKIFGLSEWAVRLPVALAGVSGIVAAFFLGSSFGGRRVGVWSALILQSSLLYFVMARFLTTDIFLTVFNVWAIYFFWRSWLVAKIEGEKPTAKNFFGWHLLGWIFVTLGFLAKGPIALAIPLVSFFILAFFRRHEIRVKKILAGGVTGFLLFLILAAPWFLAVFQSVPESEHFMVFGQAAGHLLGTTIKNRAGSPFYFFAILAVGFLPWTIWLGWIFQNSKPKVQNSQIARDARLLLMTWTIFTFALFSLSRAKLPAYILPIFPALAVLTAWKFFSDKSESVPKIASQIFAAISFLLPAIFPLILIRVFKDTLPDWLKWQTPIAAAMALAIFFLARKWKFQTAAKVAVGLSLAGFFVVVAEIPQFETSLRGNQTFQPLGMALAGNVRSGDATVCWGKFPQGLPFYAGDAISKENRPYFGGMDWTQVPFEFPGNRERLGDLVLPDETALAKLLQSGRRVWLVSFGGSLDNFQKNHGEVPLRAVLISGQWKLFVNR